MADIELIVKIPEEVYKQIKDSSTIFRDDEKMCYEAVQNGTPLAKHDEEIIKETVESIWGKPPYTELLDKIWAEIKQYQADCDLTCSDDSNCRTCNNITFGTIYQIIEKYKKGDKE